MTTATHNPTNQRRNQMKHLLTAAVLAFASPAHAETATADERPLEFCEMIGGWAQTVMETRQRGVVLSQVMVALGDDNASPEAAKVVVRDMALHAYQQPRHAGTEERMLAAANFRNEYETACYLSEIGQ
jgi:hypothetical protein